MDMPQVKACNATECAFNKNTACHAHAITIGDATAPHCDTFFNRSKKGGDGTVVAGVGACKIDVCKYNHELNCTAPAVEIGHNGSEIVCMTYTA